MAQIRIKKNYIPIPFVDENDKVKFELKFSMTDDSIKRLYGEYDKLDDLVKEVEKTADENEYEAGKEVLKHSMDAILGEGAFQKIYDDCQSIIIAVEYYAEIILLLADELRKSKVTELEKEIDNEYFG